MKFHLECKLHFPSAQLITCLKVSMLSIEFLGYFLTFYKRGDELSELPLNSSLCAVTADSQSRWPHGKKSAFPRCRLGMMFEQSLVNSLRLPRKVLVARATLVVTFVTVMVAVSSLVYTFTSISRLCFFVCDEARICTTGCQNSMWPASVWPGNNLTIVVNQDDNTVLYSQLSLSGHSLNRTANLVHSLPNFTCIFVTELSLKRTPL